MMSLCQGRLSKNSKSAPTWVHQAVNHWSVLPADRFWQSSTSNQIKLNTRQQVKCLYVFVQTSKFIKILSNILKEEPLGLEVLRVPEAVRRFPRVRRGALAMLVTGCSEAVLCKGLIESNQLYCTPRSSVCFGNILTESPMDMYLPWL